MNPPPAAPDPPLTRADLDKLVRRLETIERRSVRTETKMMRLMEHHGLDGHGKPILASQPEETPA